MSYKLNINKLSTKEIEELLSKLAKEVQKRLRREEKELSARKDHINKVLSKTLKGRTRIDPRKDIPIPVKYRLDGQHVWSGRGRDPRWLVEYEAKGGKRADLLVKKEPSMG